MQTLGAQMTRRKSVGQSVSVPAPRAYCPCLSVRARCAALRSLRSLRCRCRCPLLSSPLCPLHSPLCLYTPLPPLYTPLYTPLHPSIHPSAPLHPSALYTPLYTPLPPLYTSTSLHNVLLVLGRISVCSNTAEGQICAASKAAAAAPPLPPWPAAAAAADSVSFDGCASQSSPKAVRRAPIV